MGHRNHSRIPHPVLSKQRRDYESGYHFAVHTPHKVLTGTGKNISVIVKYDTNSPTLLDLIAKSRAGYVSLIECADTYKRERVMSFQAEDRIDLERSGWQGKFTITPYIAATENITGFQASEHRDLIKLLAPAGIDLPAGAILAIGDVEEIELEDTPSVNSIFDLAPNRQTPIGTFSTDLTGQRIAINLHPDDFSKINRVRQQKNQELLLHQSLYLHSLDLAIRNLADHGDKRWAIIIRQKLEAQGINPNGDDLADNSESWAQKIFQNPLDRMLNTLQQEGNNE